MKKAILTIILALALCFTAQAADKETLLLKQQLYMEQMAKLQAQVKVMSIEYNDAQAKLADVNKELKAIQDQEKEKK